MSTYIIDDLRSRAVADGGNQATTAFFHFSAKLGLGYVKSIDAWRAIAVQLIRAHSVKPTVVDSLAILGNETGSGQPTASAEDVKAILKLLVFRFRTYLVIDGVDECEDSFELLEILKELNQTSATRVLILSRPNLIVPRLLLQDLCPGWKLVLANEHNYNDILTFSRSEFNIMNSEGLFGKHEVTISTIELTASKANGMFLWIRLLVNLLRSPALSPYNRNTILEGANLIEGLEGLYSSILTMIGRRYKMERAIAGRIFKWIVGCLYPLSATALHAALAVDPGKPTADAQHLTQHPNLIPQITYALVEVNADGDLSFIHLSFKEYLQSEASNAFPEFTLNDERAVHAEMAAICLSYLANDIPKKPLKPLVKSQVAHLAEIPDDPDLSLQQSFGIVDRAQLSKRYPLLRYAALCWTEHLRRCLSENTKEKAHRVLAATKAGRRASYKPSINVIQLSEWKTTLSQFLTCRMSVTTWVEASWHFRLCPRVSTLLKPIKSLREQLDPTSIEDREIWWIALGLEQLSRALEELRDRHAPSLNENPTIIWQECIMSATDPHFWPTLELDDEFDQVEEYQDHQESGAPCAPPYPPVTKSVSLPYMSFIC